MELGQGKSVRCPGPMTFHFLGRLLVGRKPLPSVQPRAGVPVKDSCL